MSYGQELAIALMAVRAASLVCRDLQNSDLVSVITKDDGSPVTTADYASQAIICRTLSDMFPQDEIVAEESPNILSAAKNGTIVAQIASAVGRYIPQNEASDVLNWIGRSRQSNSATERFWLLDPIDGTKGFIANRQFAVCLALVENGRVTTAVVGCPRYSANGEGKEGTILYATAGSGAYGQPLDEEATEFPIRASARADIVKARLCHSFESSHTDAAAIARVLESVGNQVLPLCMDGQVKYAAVAQGNVDAYLRIPQSRHVERAWDHAAGSLLVIESGGKVSDLDGRPLNFSSWQMLGNRGIIASNGVIHNELLYAVSNLRST